jgi:hypothetical protein
MNRVIQRTLTNQYRRGVLAKTGIVRPTRAAQFNGGATASIAGSPSTTLGVNAPGRSSIAVQNVGRLANAVYAPSNSSGIVYSVGGAGGSGGGGPSGGGSDTLAGLTDVNLTGLINGQLLNFNSALGKWVNVSASAITGLSAGLGIAIDLGVISLKRKPSGGLDADIDGAFVMRQADSGLVLGPTGLRVGGGTGILVSGTTVNLDPAVTIRWTGTHTFALAPQLETNLAFVGAVSHEITATNTLAIKPLTDLRLDPGGVVAYPDSQKSRTDTFIDSVTGILGFELADWSAIEFPPGILGANTMGLKLNYLKVDNLFARKFTADEVRVQRGEWMLTRSFGIVEEDFTIPAVGATVDVWFEEAAGLDGAKLFLVNNWIEFKTIDLGSGLVIQTVYYKVVDGDAGGTQDYIQRLPQVGEKVSRQQWRLRRMSGGFTGMKTKKGETGADVGQPAHLEGIIQIPAQGVVYATSLFDSNGPFIQTQVFDHIGMSGPNEILPVFTNRTRMGNLMSVVDYAGEIYGFAAGDDLSKLPSAGFRGITIEALNGARLFNTNVYLYESAIIAASLTYTYGLNFLNDTTQFAHDSRVIGWYDNLAEIGPTTPTAKISSWGNVNDRRLALHSQGSQLAGVFLSATGAGGDSASLSIKGGGWYSTLGGYVEMVSQYFTNVTPDVLGSMRPRFRIGGDSGAKAISNLHVYVNDTAINGTTGITIEQDGVGDATFHWVMTGGNEFVAGIDHDDGKWKLQVGHTLGLGSPSISIDPATGNVTLLGFTGGGGSTPIDLVAVPGGGIQLSGNEISVNSSVVRTGRSVGTNSTMTGGGLLDHDLILGVNTAAVGGTLILIAGAGLTSAGALNNLGSAYTMNVGALDSTIAIAADGIAVNQASSFNWTTASVHTFNAQPVINNHLSFVGANRTILAQYDLNLSPSSNLWLTPAGSIYFEPTGAGLVLLGNANSFRSVALPEETPTAITGINLFPRPAPAAAGTWQFNISAIRTQELIARTFVSDETRVQRGQDYIAPGFGIVETTFNLPAAIDLDVPVWFENSTSDPTGWLFTNGDWLLVQIINLASGIVNMQAWLQVSGLITIDHTDIVVDGVVIKSKKRQQIMLRWKADGVAGTEIRKGVTILNSGRIGSGWIHLAAVADNAPFIDVGEFSEVISNRPKFLSRTRMGRLSGIVDYIYADNAWGFATGNNLALTPAAGFSGITADSVRGTRLFNTRLEMFEGGVKTVSVNPVRGINLLLDNEPGGRASTALSWWTTLDTYAGTDTPIGFDRVQMYAYEETPGVNDFWFLNQMEGASAFARTRITAHKVSDGPAIASSLELSSENAGHIYLWARKTYTAYQLGVGWQDYFWNNGPTATKSLDATFHVWDQTFTKEYAYEGVLIDNQARSVYMRWKQGDTNQFYSAGIDRLDGNKWKLSIGAIFGPSHDVIVVNPATGAVTINGLTGGSVVTGLVAGSGIALAGPAIAVNESVVRTTTAIYTQAGSGLQGGGTLDVSRYLSIDLDTASGMSITPTGLRIDPLFAGDGMTMTAGVLNVIQGAGIAVSANAVALNNTYVLGTTLAGRTITTRNGLMGGGTLDNNLTLDVDINPTGGLRHNDEQLEVFLATSGGLTFDAGVAINPSIAGVGLQFASGVLSVNPAIAGNGLLMSAGVINVVALNATLSVNANDMAVNQGYNFAWTGEQTWAYGVGVTQTFNSFVRFNASNSFHSTSEYYTNINFQGADRSIFATYGLTIAPAQDLTLAPDGQDVLPGGSGYTDLGDYNRKWRSLYVSELIAESLVAQDVMATIGGRIIVAPTSQLVAALTASTSDVTLHVKHNSFFNGDYIRLQTAPGGVQQTEVMKITSNVSGSSPNFIYTVTRNVDDSVVNAWEIGDAVINLGGTIGQGYLELTSTSTIHSHLGPTITIYGRTATTNWNNVKPIVSMGNLESFVDYGVTSGLQYGFATGNDLTLTPATGFSGITTDPTKGVRLFNTALELYKSGTQYFELDDGINFRMTFVPGTDWGNQISWYKDLVDAGVDLTKRTQTITAVGNATENALTVGALAGGVNGVGGRVALSASGRTAGGSSQSLNLSVYPTWIQAVGDAANGEFFRIIRPGWMRLGNQPFPAVDPIAPLQVVSNQDWNYSGGIAIFQDNTGRQLAVTSQGLFRRDGDADGGDMWLHYAGYNGGLTRYRNTFIGDGRGGTQIIGVVGATRKTTFLGPVDMATSTGASGQHPGIAHAVNTWTISYGFAGGNLARTYLVGLTFIAPGYSIASSCIYAISMGYSTVNCNKISEALFGHNSIVVTAAADTGNGRLNIYINQTNPYGQPCIVQYSILSLSISDHALQSFF